MKEYKIKCWDCEKELESKKISDVDIVKYPQDLFGYRYVICNECVNLDEY